MGVWPFCDDFHQCRKALIWLNVGYMVVAFILIGVAAASKTSAYVDSVPIVGGIVACGVFLLFLAGLGLWGTINHHQVFLFFYMIIMLLVFIIQFSIACACLAVDKQKELYYAEKGWNSSDATVRAEAEKHLQCCGFDEVSQMKRLNICETYDFCKVAGQPVVNPSIDLTCIPCKNQIEDKINVAFNSAGAVGLLFAFTEIIGAILAMRYRNQLDPKGGPGGASELFSGNM